MDLRKVLPQGLILDGKYRIERVIGAGGFGITYAAHDIGLNTTVALKEYYPAEFGMRDSTMSIRARSSGDQGLFDRLRLSFVEEARTLAKFRQRSIVRVQAVFEAHGTAYMVMEFEEGRSLKAWMRELGRRPTQDEVDGIFYPLLDALETLHEASFLHRDIAPDNIIIRPNGDPVLLDFGAARRVAATERSSQMTGLIKLGYSPQEQYTSDGKAQGAWSDIYALAATLYHVVTGAPPPEAPVRYLEDTMSPAILAEGDWRKDFLAGIDRSLAVRPQDRPQSIAELRPLLFDGYEPPVRTSTRRASLPLERQHAARASVDRETGRGAVSVPRRAEEDVAAPLAFAATGASEPASNSFRLGLLASLLAIAVLGAYQLNMSRHSRADIPTDAVATPGPANRAEPSRQPDATTTTTRRQEAARTDSDEARRAQDRIDAQRRSEDVARRADESFREAVRHVTGNGVPVDHARALPLFETAAEAGRSDAMSWLGRIHQAGLGVTQDFRAAIDWFRRAANAGDEASMVELGRMYARGQGVPQDYLNAREWFMRAADLGNIEGIYALGQLYFRGLGVTQDPAKARDYFERAAQAGHVQSMINLALANKNGQGGPVDLAKSREWYEKAAAAGNAGAMNQLGVAFHNGEGVTKDPVTARAWYERAIAGGNTTAMVNMARLLSSGQGGAANATRAASLVLVASRQGTGSDPISVELASNMARWSKETRTEIKRELKRLGHYKGVVNDIWDEPARQAVAAYRTNGK